jgi:hypothetical protein
MRRHVYMERSPYSCLLKTGDYGNDVIDALRHLRKEPLEEHESQELHGIVRVDRITGEITIRSRNITAYRYDSKAIQ